MNKYLPSKRFLLILLSVVIALGIVYGFSNIKNPGITGVELTGIETKTKVQEFMALDSDNDGLKDWEEALYKTDPKVTDTDKDGTSDGDEVKINRDPLKTNTAFEGQEPNDKIDEKIIAAEKKAEEDFNKLTTTDKLSRELFSQYIATRKIGVSLTATDIQNIVGNFMINIPPVDYKKEYATKDLIIDNSTSTKLVKEYGNQVSEILLKNIATKTEDIYAIITDYLSPDVETLPTDDLIRLDPIISKTQLTISALLQVRVPKEISADHLRLINTFEKIREDIQAMRDSKEDLVTMMNHLNQHNLNIDTLSETLTNLANYIFSKKYNIAYAPTDFGYQFFNVIIFGQ